MRILLKFFIFSCLVFCSDLKILKIVPFGTDNLKIVFNRTISQNDFTFKKLEGNKSMIEVRAVLIPYPRKVFNFPSKNQVVIGQNTPKIVRIVLLNNGKKSYDISFVEQTLYLKLLDNTKNPSQKKFFLQQEKRQVAPQKQEQISKVRKYRIVIDPGHGGKDCGATAVTKVCEKTIVLSVAKKLEEELKKKGYQVFMTRDKDVYIDLKKRTEMANTKNADLFISIHANSVPKTSNSNSQGVETYFLSTARSERARDVAEQENKGDVETMGYFSKLSFLNTLNSHRLIASNKLAIDIQVGILRELKKNYNNVIDGGVREGPFWVLAGALMPSVLIEIGYVSNEVEARRLNTKEYQQYLAAGIANGVDGFIAKNF